MRTALNRTAAEKITDDNKLLIRLLGAAAFLVMFQAYLVAPLIPSLTQSFHTDRSLIGLAVHIFTIPYGLSSLFYGPLSDRFGRRALILSLLAFL
jgi:predicted MFS family arabinose efflux permease